MEKNPFYYDSLLEKIKDLPVWVKQAFYVDLREHLKSVTPFETLEAISKHNLIQLYMPHLTQMGFKYIKSNGETFETKGMVVSKDMKNFLDCSMKKLRIIDICQIHNWPLSHAAKILTDCIDAHLIEPVYSDFISSTIYFLANKIRIGEYLVRTGKITVEQLDMALYSQKYTEDTMGDRIFLAQILINLGYIQTEDYENIIFLKQYGEELFSMSFNDSISEVSDDVANLKNEIIKLRQERLKLRENLSKFSGDAETIANLLSKIDNLKNDINAFHKENQKIKGQLDLYMDELMATTQENVELREQLENK
jgi:regulator of replication initiation timing